MKETSSQQSVEPLSLEENRELQELIRKTALVNAVKHNGQAQIGPIVGKIMGEKPDLRTKAKELTGLISKVLHEVNRLSLDDQKQIVKEKWPEVLAKEKAEPEKRLPPLPNVDKYPIVVTRFAPNPDCVLHLGSARAIILCYEYAKLYSGKFVLRFEDTDPKTKRPALEFYDAIRYDLSWLGTKPDVEAIQSDRIPIYYDYAEKLIKNGNAYVCTCELTSFREKVLAGQPCMCRDLPPEEHLTRWNRMLSGGYREGEVVVRVKTDLNHPNPAVRDWPALRLIDIDKYPHPRVGTKYRVWPLYNLAAGLDDHLLGITFIIRGKEHLTNQVRQEYLYRHLGWTYPKAIHYGRLKITGATLSKSKIVQGIRKELYKSWDDPRLATFAALRRRGIMPDAIKKMIVDVGPKTSDVILSWENLYAYNRKNLDQAANRYFFIQNPIELKVKNVQKTFLAQLNLHPDHQERGVREYSVKPNSDAVANLWISGKDFDSSKLGEMIRLMELFNVKVESVNPYGVESSFVSESYQDARKTKAQLIHWIPIGQDIPCEVVMPDASIAQGIAETACTKLSVDDIVQFERFGFARIDNVGKKLTAYYSHK